MKDQIKSIPELDPSQTEIIEQFWQVCLNPESKNLLMDLQKFQHRIISAEYQSKMTKETFDILNELITQAREYILHSDESLQSETHRALATTEG